MDMHCISLAKWELCFSAFPSLSVYSQCGHQETCARLETGRGAGSIFFIFNAGKMDTGPQAQLELGHIVTHLQSYLVGRGSIWAPASSSRHINFPDTCTRCLFSSMMEGTSSSFVQLVFSCCASHPSSFPSCRGLQVPAPDAETWHPYLGLLTRCHSTARSNPYN